MGASSLILMNMKRGPGQILRADVEVLEGRILLASDAPITVPSYTEMQISGVVFEDLNGNHSPDAGERRFSGVNIYDDHNSNDRFDLGELNLVSGQDGRFAFGFGVSINDDPVGPHLKLSLPTGWLWTDRLAATEDGTLNFPVIPTR